MRAVGLRMVCITCGIVGADARPELEGAAAAEGAHRGAVAKLSTKPRKSFELPSKFWNEVTLGVVQPIRHP